MVYDFVSQNMSLLKDFFQEGNKKKKKKRKLENVKSKK